MRPVDNSPAQAKGFYTPPMRLKSASPKTWTSEKKQQSMSDLFHVIHKVPSGDSPYVKAKHVQLIEKDPGKAVSLFWSAINAGDRVDSALKDMAVVMKQLDRSDEAIEAIKSFRHLCSPASQESLDNVLVELYKRSGRLGEQIQILQHKLKQVEEGNAFGGKRVKLARSQGKKVHITVEQEYARLLGNLAWAYLQQNDYKTAEEYYRKALSIEVDRNKQCNLAVCLIYMNRIIEAKFLLQVIRDSAGDGQMDESYAKSYERACQLLAEIESQPVRTSSECYNWKTTYTPPVATKGLLPSCPFTQPRRASGLPDNGKWRKELSGNDSVNRSQRRLQFEKPVDSKLLSSEVPETNLNVVPIEELELDDKLANVSITNSSPCQLAITTPTDAMSAVSGAQSEHEQDQDFPLYQGKKSWADMADEEEQEELLMMNGVFSENVDLNMMGPSQNPQSPGDNLSSKFQSFALDEHSTARRSLLFDQQHKQDLVKPNRSGRLKVFQDITPSP